MTVNDFLKQHRLRSGDIDFTGLVRVFKEDMDLGLEGIFSSLRMIPTYIEAENEFLCNTPVLAIDAGGTNFRAALYTFKDSGEVEKGEEVREMMPGINGEISAKEFFETIASFIRPLASHTERIGFCFSYPTEIFPDKDGKLLQFCKEVQAPEVVGQLIGKRLLETMGTPSKKIVLLNDTVATLLAGKSASMGNSYDSYIGYILGTGTNTCYIEANRKIVKIQESDKSKSQIINIESGAFGKGPRTDLDILFDSSTIDPGKYMFEKMFAGGYFGGLSLTVLKAAAREELFSGTTQAMLAGLTDLTSGAASDFLTGSDTVLNRIFCDSDDCEKARCIIDSLIDRAACLSAANIAAVVLKTGKGRQPEYPLLITIEGTAFYKLHDLKSRFEKYLNEFLTGENERFIQFIRVDQSSLVGAALAGLITD